MQDTITSNGSAKWSEHLDDGAQSRNLAAIALAEAMHRARTIPHGEARIAATQPAPSLSPKARLDALRKKLQPLYAAIPQDVEGVDLGVVREDKPRLFLDMISFIDVSEDSKNLRLVNGGRNGPQVLHETADETALVARITDYIAERLIVRERLLEQGNPVVIGAQHFSRGVTAGVGLHSTSMEPIVVPAAPLVSAPQNLDVKQAASAVQEPTHDLKKQESAATTTIDKAVAEEIVQQKVLAPSAQTAQPLKVPVATVAQAPTQALAHQAAQVKTTTSFKPTGSPAKHAASNVTRGWWLWPVLAMLVGMGFAAYLLYLYSMSFAS
jgi:hypothetical protein